MRLLRERGAAYRPARDARVVDAGRVPALDLQVFYSLPRSDSRKEDILTKRDKLIIFGFSALLLALGFANGLALGIAVMRGGR